MTSHIKNVVVADVFLTHSRHYYNTAPLSGCTCGQIGKCIIMTAVTRQGQTDMQWVVSAHMKFRRALGHVGQEIA